MTLTEAYKLELTTLMSETNKKLPLLILSCHTGDVDYESVLSCARIVQELELYKLEHDWQIRSCQIVEHKMKDIILGFEWIINELNQNQNR
jgi:hypothetical protein